MWHGCISDEKSIPSILAFLKYIVLNVSHSSPVEHPTDNIFKGVCNDDISLNISGYLLYYVVLLI